MQLRRVVVSYLAHRAHVGKALSHLLFPALQIRQTREEYPEGAILLLNLSDALFPGLHRPRSNVLMGASLPGCAVIRLCVHHTAFRYYHH